MRGVYPRIPGSYSQTLEKFISQCLQLDPKSRPSCKELIKLLPQSNKESDSTSAVNLLSTIRVPKNLQSWRDELPKSNYTSEANTK